MPSELRNRGRPADANASDDASTATADGWAPPKQPFVHHETSAFTRINSGTQTDLTMADIAAMSAKLGVRGVPSFGQLPYTADAYLATTHPMHHTATLTSHQRTSSPVAPGQGDGQSAGSRPKTRRGVYCEDVGSVRAAGLLFLIVGSVWMWSAMNQTQPPIPGPIPPPPPPPSPPPIPGPITPPPPPPTQPSPPPTVPPKYSLVVSSNRDTIARMLTLSETHKRLTPNGSTHTLDSIYWSPAGDGRFTVVSSEDGWNATATEETLTALLAKYTRIYIVEMVTQTRFSRSPFRNELHDGIRAAKPNSVNVTTVFWDTSCSVMATLMQKEYNWPRVDEAACHEDPDGEFTKFGTWAAVRKGGIDPSALTLVGVPRGTSIEEQARMIFESSGITPQ